MIDPSPYTPKPSLFTTVRKMTVARGDQASKLLGHLQRSLERGADPNAHGRDGGTALDMLRHVNGQSDWRILREAALLLMVHGANAQHEYSHSGIKTTILTNMAQGVVVNDGKPGNVWTHLASALVEGTADQERRGIFAAGNAGNNPLHTACEHGLELVPYLLQKQLFRPEWVVQPNDNGDTPLHCLWKKREHITDLLHYNGMDRTIEALWQATKDLVVHGADLSMANAKGEVPLVLIKDMVRQGLRQRGCAPLVLSFAQAAEIAAAVPTVATHSSAPRL